MPPQESAVASLIHKATVSAALEEALGRHPCLQLVAGLLPAAATPLPVVGLALVSTYMAGGDAQGVWARCVDVALLLPCVRCLPTPTVCIIAASHCCLYRLGHAPLLSPLPLLKSMLQVGVATASAAAAMHAAGWAHLDIKSENVLVEVGPQGIQAARLADFDLSQRLCGNQLRVCLAPAARCTALEAANKLRALLNACIADCNTYELTHHHLLHTLCPFYVVTCGLPFP